MQKMHKKVKYPVGKYVSDILKNHFIIPVVYISLFLCISSTNVFSASKKVLSVPKYYTSFQYVTPKICIVTDWDDVVVYPKSSLSKGISALSVLPARVIVSAFFGNIKNIWKGMGAHGLYDKYGNKIIGTGEYIRLLAEKEPRIMQYYKRLLRTMARTKPIDSTINLYQDLQQKHGLPVIVWTNTDPDLFIIKYKDCNYRRVQQKMPPLMLDGYFCVGHPTAEVFSEQCTTTKKPQPDFYMHALAYSKQVVRDADDSWIYVYIDDKAKNIQAAREYAAQTGAPIIAIQYTTHKQLLSDLHYVFLLLRPQIAAH